jgi:hypothetical protein
MFPALLILISLLASSRCSDFSRSADALSRGIVRLPITTAAKDPAFSKRQINDAIVDSDVEHKFLISSNSIPRLLKKCINNIPQLELERLPRMLLLALTLVPVISGFLERALLQGLRIVQQQPLSISPKSRPLPKINEGGTILSMEWMVQT